MGKLLRIDPRRARRRKRAAFAERGLRLAGSLRRGISRAEVFWIAMAAMAAFIVSWFAAAFISGSELMPAERAVLRAGTYYPDCDTARALGEGPIPEGQPGYRSKLDADGDGTACEPLPEGR